MDEPVKTSSGRPRRYRSPLRDEQARRTRRAILTAASELFLERGYAATTMDAVAERAGVATDTVYHVVRSKRRLLKEVLDVTIGGDDRDVPMLDRERPQQMRRETDQRRQLAMFARGIAEQLERVRPMDDILRSAAAVDAEAATLRADLQLRQRREAMTGLAGWVAANGPLRDGMPVDDAAATIWTLTSPEVHALLRDGWGWSAERYAGWLHDTLERTLLPDDRPGS
jgi:AcrR family transcriptional regulator